MNQPFNDLWINLKNIHFSTKRKDQNLIIYEMETVNETTTKNPSFKINDFVAFYEKSTKKNILIHLKINKVENFNFRDFQLSYWLISNQSFFSSIFYFFIYLIFYSSIIFFFLFIIFFIYSKFLSKFKIF